MYEIFIVAYESWSKKYRPKINRSDVERLAQLLSKDSAMICFGAFFRETGKLCGFMQVPTYDNYAELQVQRVIPMYEKYQINAALVYNLLTYNAEKLNKENFYILDGARSINHETNFQEYLNKYFGFRKAFCKLNIPIIQKLNW